MIYLGGPFFNPKQVEVAKKMIELCKKYEVDYFAPLEQDSAVIKDEKQAKEVFDNNINNIDQCTILLAQLEWLMPEGQELRVIEDHGEVVQNILLKSPPLNLPDTGTVFEMGAAYLTGTNIIGYMTEPQEKINLMLAQSCEGFLHGWEQIEAFFASDCSLSCTMKKWEGKIQ